MKKEKKTGRKIKLIIWVILIFIIYLVIKEYQKSIFLRSTERVNLIFYFKTPLFFSLSKKGPSYYLKLNPEIKIAVAGGYGFYRLGALGKLINLEKKPVIFKRTFSLLTSSMVDLYFYPCQPVIYYEQIPVKKERNYSFNSFFSCTNGNFLDRFLVFYYLSKFNNQLIQLKPITTIDNRFDNENFFKKNQGVFYKQRYRKENKTIQILYRKSYKTAINISQIIEGEGIRVNDIDQIDLFLSRNPKFSLNEKNFKNQCFIVEEAVKPSLTAKKLIDFFNCHFLKDKTEFSDIILLLGEKEKEWE